MVGQHPYAKHVYSTQTTRSLEMHSTDDCEVYCKFSTVTSERKKMAISYLKLQQPHCVVNSLYGKIPSFEDPVLQYVDLCAQTRQTMQ